MKPSVLTAAILTLIIPVRAGDVVPGDQVKSAVRKLADAPNYSWTVSVASAEKSRFTPGPVEGRTEKGGCTQWRMNFGDRCTEAFTNGDRVAVKTDEGWVKPEERRAPSPPQGDPPSPPSPAPVDSKPPPSGDSPPPRSPDGERRKNDWSRGSKTGFLARRLQSMKTPAELASELAGKVTLFTAAGDTISGELSAGTVKELLAFGHRRDGHGPPEPTNPRGKVTFFLKDGQLQKMELHLAATICFNGTDLPLDRVTVFDIKDVGTTKLEIPAQAQPLLEPAPVEKKPA